MIDLTIIILTYNEELHIKRILESFNGIAKSIIVVDSYSTDQTVKIASAMGATVFQHKFLNYAKQFEWALELDCIQTNWVMRMDADEYLTPQLADEIKNRLSDIPTSVNGIILKRQVHFLGQWIRYGGYYPIKLLRIWRRGSAMIEQRWMDEHMVLLNGEAIEFKHDIVDDNLNSLTWWTDKHNSYATREAIDLLDRKHGFLEKGHPDGTLTGTKQAQSKRWYKNNLYSKAPLFFRAWLYFLFRYWIKLGFLDGRKGLIWHFLQGFWYRFLVDAKIMQIEWWMKQEQKTIKQVLEEKFNIKI